MPNTIVCTCDDEEEYSSCRIHVSCDQSCKAFRNPNTFPEAIETLIHHRDHEHLGGCSHGR